MYPSSNKLASAGASTEHKDAIPEEAGECLENLTPNPSITLSTNPGHKSQKLPHFERFVPDLRNNLAIIRRHGRPNRINSIMQGRPFCPGA
jgi:hypothetical protein